MPPVPVPLALTDLYRTKLSSDPAGLNFSGLRDALLAVDPLNQPWVVSVNKAESEFWKRSAGTRQGYSDEILGFDCGGQQWVLEVRAFGCVASENSSCMLLRGVGGVSIKFWG